MPFSKPNSLHFFLVYLSGELLCTRVRCSSSNYNYTNYRASAVDENTLENLVMSILNKGVFRGKDWCLECDSEPVSPVCGPNWKTYRSICHAFHCGGFDIEDIKQGKCENLVSSQFLFLQIIPFPDCHCFFDSGVHGIGLQMNSWTRMRYSARTLRGTEVQDLWQTKRNDTAAAVILRWFDLSADNADQKCQYSHNSAKREQETLRSLILSLDCSASCFSP